MVTKDKTSAQPGTLAQPGTTTEPPAAVLLSPRRAKFLALAAAPAKAIAEHVGPGCRVCGVTKGQFGMTELLGAVASRARTLTGEACDVDAWSWAMHLDDAALLGGYRRKGYIRSVRFIFDRSFPRRHPEWIDALEREMGGDLYGSNVHAKVVLVRAGALRLVITGSMNFNINHRFEHFEVQDDPALWTHWRDLTDWMCARIPRGLRAVEGLQYHESFKSALLEGARSEAPAADPAAGDDASADLGADLGADLEALSAQEFSASVDLETQLSLLEGV